LPFAAFYGWASIELCEIVPYRYTPPFSRWDSKERANVTTEEIIIHIFYHVDNAMLSIPKHPLSKLYPSEVVTIGILFALKGGHFRAFYGYYHAGSIGGCLAITTPCSVGCRSERCCCDNSRANKYIPIY
jgi:hypothetical protein